MKWTDWKSIDDPPKHDSHAVYKVRAKLKGRILHVPRFLRQDEDGLLCIGKTTSMETRRRRFVGSCRLGKRGHSGGFMLHLVLSHCKRIRSAALDLEYCFAKVRSRGEAGSLESEEINQYVRDFGEVPPLNSSLPQARARKSL